MSLPQYYKKAPTSLKKRDLSYSRKTKLQNMIKIKKNHSYKF